MPSKLSVHWHKTHYQEERDRANFAAWKPRSVKLIVDADDVKGAEVVPPESLLVVRHYSLSENWHARGITDAAHAKNMAVTHAAKCKQLADWLHANVPQRDLDNTVFTGLNEPQVWVEQGGKESPELTTLYYRTFLAELHRFGLHGVALNLSVGHPTNHGVPDAPVDWKPYEPILDAIHPGDYLGKHGYWPHFGPEWNFKWYGGDWTQIPWNVPILISECGLDEYTINVQVEADRRGWRGWLSPQEYMNQLAWYDSQLRADPRVHSAQVYDYDFAHPWSSFDIREGDFMDNVFLPFVANQQNVPDPVEPQPPEPPPANALYTDIVGTLPKHPTKRYPARTKKVVRVVIHHTASPRDTTTPEAIARYHIAHWDWAGSAYHLVVTGDGKAYLVNRLNTVPAGAGGYNEDSVHLTFTGNFTVSGGEKPSDAQLATGKKVLAWLLKELNLKPENVTGHKNLPGHTTKCPGDTDWWRQLLGNDDITVTTARWNTEEAAREARAGQGQAAHDRLVQWVVPFLRKLEGV